MMLLKIDSCKKKVKIMSILSLTVYTLAGCWSIQIQAESLCPPQPASIKVPETADEHDMLNPKSGSLPYNWPCPSASPACGATCPLPAHLTLLMDSSPLIKISLSSYQSPFSCHSALSPVNLGFPWHQLHLHR